MELLDTISKQSSIKPTQISKGTISSKGYGLNKFAQNAKMSKRKTVQLVLSIESYVNGHTTDRV